MDIQIKYKEFNKKDEVTKLVAEAVREGMRHNGKFRDKLVNQIMSIMIDNSVYNQTRPKEIESITIPGIFENSTHIFKAVVCEGNKKDYIYLSLPDVWKIDKGNLKELIDILQQIHDQMN